MHVDVVPSVMPRRDRTKTGEFVETVSQEDVVGLLEEMYDPVVTVKDIADKLDCSGETARRKLSDLHGRGRVKKMQVGANAVVWWLNEDRCERCGEEWATQLRTITTGMEPVGRFEEAPEADLSNVHPLCEDCAKDYDIWEGEYNTMNEFLESEPKKNDD